MITRTLTASLLAGTIAMGGLAGAAPAASAPAVEPGQVTSETPFLFGHRTVSENGAGLLGLVDAAHADWAPVEWMAHAAHSYPPPNTEFEAQTASVPSP